MTNAMAGTTVLLEGLHFAESPSCGPDGALYVSDFYAHQVLRVEVDSGTPEVVAKVPGQPSGLGWLPDGRLLVVSMRDRQLLRQDADGELRQHADLSAVAIGAANDMLVDATGRSWVGSFGFDFYAQLEADPQADPLFGPEANPPTATLAVVEPDGTVRPSASGLRFPNGMAQLSGNTLVVAETVGGVLSAFTINQDGSLTNRRVWADLSASGPGDEPILPDGICADHDGAVWVSDPTHSRAVKVHEGGEVSATVRTTQPCFAVGLAGVHKRTLVCCTAPTSNPNVVATSKQGRLEIMQLG